MQGSPPATGGKSFDGVRETRSYQALEILLGEQPAILKLHMALSEPCKRREGRLRQWLFSIPLRSASNARQMSHTRIANARTPRTIHSWPPAGARAPQLDRQARREQTQKQADGRSEHQSALCTLSFANRSPLHSFQKPLSTPTPGMSTTLTQTSSQKLGHRPSLKKGAASFKITTWPTGAPAALGSR